MFIQLIFQFFTTLACYSFTHPTNPNDDFLLKIFTSSHFKEIYRFFLLSRKIFVTKIKVRVNERSTVENKNLNDNIVVNFSLFSPSFLFTYTFSNSTMASIKLSRMLLTSKSLHCCESFFHHTK